MRPSYNYAARVSPSRIDFGSISLTNSSIVHSPACIAGLTRNV